MMNFKLTVVVDFSFYVSTTGSRDSVHIYNVTESYMTIMFLGSSQVMVSCSNRG